VTLARRLANRLRLSPAALPGARAERHSSWLEVFFDLVFALALLSVQGRLQQGSTPTLGRLLATFGLFAVVWLAWTGQAFYDTRFDPDDLPHRLGVLVAMVGAGAMALGAADAPNTALLPVGLLTSRGVLILLYLRVHGTGPDTNPLTTVYLLGFSLGWLLWLASLAVEPGTRPALWIAGTVIEFATPWVGRHWLLRVPVNPTHLPERIGLFTIILLGVTLTNLLDAVPARPSWQVIGSAAVAFVIPASVWWVYSTFVATGLALSRLSAGLAYSYVHTVLGAALLLLGWALGQVLREIAAGSTQLPDTLRLLLGVSIGAWMFCGLGLQWVSLGYLPGARIGIAVLSLGGLAAVMIMAPAPAVLLVLLAAVLLGYAIAVSRHILRLGSKRQP
jgi:low temperature requirement protein LtrA